MRVIIDTIPHSQQRYDTCGDWQFVEKTVPGENGTESTETVLFIRVSANGDWRSEMAVAYHEMLEALACKANGIAEAAVDEFDKRWKPSEKIEEPGQDPAAPYHLQHVQAIDAEDVFLKAVGLGIGEHCKLIESRKA